MSHIVKVQCQVTDLELLTLAAKKLGLQTIQNATPRYYGSAYGGSESFPCELVVKLPGKYDLGVKQDGGLYTWVCDSELLSGSYGLSDAGRRLLGTNAENLMTAYGQAQVERDLLAGGVYTQSSGPDGSVYYDIEEGELARLGYGA